LRWARGGGSVVAAQCYSIPVALVQVAEINAIAVIVADAELSGEREGVFPGWIPNVGAHDDGWSLETGVGGVVRSADEWRVIRAGAVATAVLVADFPQAAETTAEIRHPKPAGDGAITRDVEPTRGQAVGEHGGLRG